MNTLCTYTSLPVLQSKYSIFFKVHSCKRSLKSRKLKSALKAVELVKNNTRIQLAVAKTPESEGSSHGVPHSRLLPAFSLHNALTDGRPAAAPPLTPPLHLPSMHPNRIIRNRANIFIILNCLSYNLQNSINNDYDESRYRRGGCTIGDFNYLLYSSYYIMNKTILLPVRNYD